MVSDTNDGRIPPELLKKRLLALLETRKGEFAPSNPEIDKYEHSLQCATRALKAGEPPDYVVMALFHDVFGGFDAESHGWMLNMVLNPYLKLHARAAVSTHEASMAELRAPAMPGTKRMNSSRTFASNYDMPSFDPNYPSLPLDHFLPIIDEVIK